MSQFIDSYFADQFTDGTVRFASAGIRDLATSNWRASLAQSEGAFTIRVYFDGVLTDVDAPKPVALVPSEVALKLYDDSGALSETLPFSGWVAIATGVYTATSGGVAAGSHNCEVGFRATFSNPAVSGKVSVITDGASNYPGETILVDWIASSMGVEVSSSGTFSGQDPAFDGVDFATGFSYR
jgi:hypothetical protein